MEIFSCVPNLATLIFLQALSPTSLIAVAEHGLKDQQPSSQFSSLLAEGQAHFEKGAYEAALSSFQQARNHQQQLYDAFLWLGKTYSKLNQPDQAILHLRTAIALAPDRAEAYYDRARAYAKKSKYYLAGIDFETFLEHQPDHARSPGQAGEDSCF